MDDLTRVAVVETEPEANLAVSLLRNEGIRAMWRMTDIGAGALGVWWRRHGADGGSGRGEGRPARPGVAGSRGVGGCLAASAGAQSRPGRSRRAATSPTTTQPGCDERGRALRLSGYPRRESSDERLEVRFGDHDRDRGASGRCRCPLALLCPRGVLLHAHRARGDADPTDGGRAATARAARGVATGLRGARRRLGPRRRGYRRPDPALRSEMRMCLIRCGARASTTSPR